MEDHSIVSDVGIADLAGRSAMAAVEMSLLARGLLEQIDACRVRDVGTPIPVPGIADVPDSIRGHALDAVRSAETCRALVESANPAPAGVGSGAVVAALTEAWQRTDEARSAAGRALRWLAQIGLGVVEHSSEHDEAGFLEHAATGVLASHGEDVLPSDDEFYIEGTTRDEVSVELAGLIARLRWQEHPGSAFAIVADLEPLFAITATAEGGLDIAVGGPGDPLPGAARILAVDGEGGRAVRGPVTTLELTEAILDTLAVWGVEPRRIQVVWRK